MSYDPAKNTFLNESKELLEDMEQALLHLENEPTDEDAINAIFRAAHTIKGTAGIFGFDNTESFTHVVENVLDAIRGDKVHIDTHLIEVLLGSRDHMQQLVQYAVDEHEMTEEFIHQGDALLAELKQYLEETDVDDTKKKAETMQARNETEDMPEIDVNYGPLEWQIEVDFGGDVLRNGMDPLSFLRYLSKHGEVAHVRTLYERMPEINIMDPEECYLKLVIDFISESATRQDIEQVFDFVKDDCILGIFPPAAKIWENIERIEHLPDEIYAIGEMLTKSGTLSQDELYAALEKQDRMRSSSPDGKAPPLGKMLVDEKSVAEPVVEAALNKQQKAKDNRTVAARQLRVDADKLDKLINLVGELVIAGATTNLLAQSTHNNQLLESMSSMSHLVEEIRDSALRLRMVQIGETFSRFNRVVRDVSAEIGKDIRLELLGGETELDKTMVEKIGDPLMHLVRNAMDHGIESAQDRLRKGKPEQGLLKLNAYHDSGSIVIQVIDDGNGLNKQRILAKAMERGLVDSDKNLSDQEIFRLIFEPGFSTAAQITNLSGRGVGMDVVRKNIESLRGNVDVESTEGVGTTINIRLPLTLAIIDGFLVEVAGANYVIPLDMVVECIELNEDDQNLSVHSDYINLRGKVLPFLRLSHLFDEESNKESRENVVVVQNGGQSAGLVVDALLGEFQTVIKPLGKLFQHLKGVSGSTILGSGEVAVILDVPGLIQQAVEHSSGVQPLAQESQGGSHNQMLH
ncbi:MAG: chemotaxis protein CheA [Gammaproteobacteria bacterium]|nr:chemotaxis protein CheA [Gammaproteobacteria bacterium]MDH5728430.1 chemotaxis protein CheA [Gammaproteobacteria bacterium]